MANLKINLFGHELRNPVMPAAGPNCRTGALLKDAADKGVGALVMKTVSVKPAPVPYPNIASVGKDTLMNAELWSELPVEQYIEKEYEIAKESGLMQIAGLGYSAEELAELGPRVEATGFVDAFEFSIHYLGKDYTPVIESAKALKKAVSKPIMAKISPGFPDIPGLVKALDPIVDGYVAVNSLGPGLDFDPASRTPFLGSESGYGWVSGKAIFPLALRIVYELSALTKKPVLGVGGIYKGVDAIKMMMAGACAVQVCSAAIEYGNGIYKKIADEMSEWLDQNGFDDVNQIVGLFRRETHAENLRPIPFKLVQAQCIRCWKCVKGCIHGGIMGGANGYPEYTDNCIHCGYCTTICPKQALVRT